MKVLRRATYVISIGLALLIFAVWMARTFWLPNLSALAPMIEARLSEAFKQPVKVNGFRAQWHWAYIDLHIDSLIVGAPAPTLQTPLNKPVSKPVNKPLSPTQKAAPLAANTSTDTLRLDQVNARMALLPLLTGTINAQYITLEKAFITAHHSTQGWAVAGVDLAKDTASDPSQWIATVLNAQSVTVQQLTIQVQDTLNRYAPREPSLLTFDAVQLSRQGWTHQFSLKNQNPFAIYGLPQVALKGQFESGLFSDIAKPSTWRNGSATLTLNELNIQAVRNALAAALPALADTTNHLETVLGKTANTLLRVRFDNGRWGGNLDATFKPPYAHAPQKLAISWPKLSEANSLATLKLDGFNLAQASQWLPTQAQPWLRQWLDAVKPSGHLKQLEVVADIRKDSTASLALNAVDNIKFQGALVDFSAQAGGLNLGGTSPQPLTTPDIGHLSTQFSGQYVLQKKPSFELDLAIDSQHAWIRLPALFDPKALELDSLKGTVNVLYTMGDKPQLRIKSPSLKLHKAQLQMTLSGAYQNSFLTQPAHIAETFELKGQFEQLPLNAVYQFLPSTVGTASKSWVQHALQGGTASSGQFKVWQVATPIAPLETAPTQPSKPHFQLSANIDNAQLRITPQWPQIESIQGKLSIQDDSLKISNARGVLQTIALDVPALQIDHLANPVLVINGSAKGAGQAFLQVAKSIPELDLGQFKPNIDGTATVSGSWRLPIDNPKNITFKADLALQAKQAQWLPSTPPMTDLSAALTLTEQDFKVNHAVAQWLGGNIQAQGSAAWPQAYKGEILPKQAGQIQLKGSVNVDQIKQLSQSQTLFTPWQHRWVTALNTYLHGLLDYNATISTSPAGWVIMARSDVSRLAIDIPKLYNKPAGQALPISMTAISGKQLLIEAEVDQQLAVSLEDHKIPSTGAWHFNRGNIALGRNAVQATPDQGLHAHIVLPELDADALRVFLASLPWSTSDSTQGFDAPLTMAVQVDQLTLAQRQFKNVVAGVARDALGSQAGNWRANVNAEGVNGYITWVEAAQRNSSGTLTAQLQTLNLPDSEIKSASSLLDIQPSQVPHLDIEVDQLYINQKLLGSLKLNATNQNSKDQTERGWSIDALSLKTPDSELTAQGAWKKTNNIPSVEMTANVNIHNFGATLARLGQANVVRNGAGKLSGRVAWNGSPFALDIPSLTGTVQMSLDKGQFLKLEPGSGRLLGVFSLQSIPRRLTLDFRDLFSAGFAFDTIRGDATLKSGILSTQNFVMQSAAAKIQGTGSVNLLAETQNLLFTVRPDFNAGGVSVAYMLINPPLGLGTLLLQWLLRDPLNAQLTVQYDVTGPWSTPVVTQRERSVKLKDAAKVDAN